MTKLSFEETLIEVWRQALVENAKVVQIGNGGASLGEAERSVHRFPINLASWE